MNKYFYDSYAIIEFIKGNPKFKEYFTEVKGITSFYNLMEVYYSTLKDNGETKARDFLNLFINISVQPITEDIESSMKFRFLNVKKKFSYADCLGYNISKREKLKFLTGDEAFRNFPNVEFVKA